MSAVMGYINRNQHGDGEVGLLLTVILVFSLLSGAILTLQWIKATKDARTAGRASKIEQVVERNGDAGYSLRYLPGICGRNPCGG